MPLGSKVRMEFMDQKQKEIDAQREECNREELVERITRAMPEDGIHDPLKGLYLSRSSASTAPVYGVAVPSFCVIAQGSKEVSLGEKQYKYDPYSYLLATVELPIVSRVLAASKDRPYLGFRLNIDPVLVGSVMVEMGQLSTRNQEDAKAITVSALDTTLLDAVLRMVRLLDSPLEARMLLPLISREIVYRLLVGEQGDRLRLMTVPGGHIHRISQAVEKICREFSQPLHVEELARQIGMSVSGFHHHFKSVTAMSPLQFQKQLRLTEARRLMLGENLDAATAGYRVGYDDASHFNREYKRLFGDPPMRDVERLKEAVEMSADV